MNTTQKAATLLNGREVSDSVTESLKETLQTLPYQPQLVVVRVGEDPASVSYVRGKDRTAKKLGLSSRVEVLPESTQQGELMALIAELNTDDEVDGILVQDPSARSPRHQTRARSHRPGKRRRRLSPGERRPFVERTKGARALYASGHDSDYGPLRATD